MYINPRCRIAWLIPPALGAGNRKFESCHRDHYYGQLPPHRSVKPRPVQNRGEVGRGERYSSCPPRFGALAQSGRAPALQAGGSEGGTRMLHQIKQARCRDQTGRLHHAHGGNGGQCVKELCGSLLSGQETTLSRWRIRVPIPVAAPTWR